MAKQLPFYIALLLLVALLFFNNEGYRFAIQKDESNIIYSDTAYQKEERAFNVTIPDPKVIVLDKNKKWQEELTKIFGELKVKQDILTKVNDSLMEELNLYSDTLSDENIAIHYNSLVHGNLLSSDISYTLKVPKIITNTIEKPIRTNKNQWLLVGEAGGNKQSFSNLSLGVQHISKGGFLKGYKYNLLQNEHYGIIGVRLFK